MKHLLTAALALSVFNFTLPLQAKSILVEGEMPLKGGGTVYVKMCVEINEAEEQTVTDPNGGPCDAEAQAEPVFVPTYEDVEPYYKPVIPNNTFVNSAP